MSTPFNQVSAEKVVSILLRPAEAEAAKPRQKSQVTDLSGVTYESPNEKLERILKSAVTYGLQQGLLILPANIDDVVYAYLYIGKDLG